ncbi:MAG TPA: DNA internalization-related competence protein ComEC/Rec2 [Burkholderiales bacterium]|nr:DNA internalization-related competence protein ComEC/Rec2 [Burkholderiales bacterium]
MTLLAAAFAAGAALLQLQPELPPLIWALALVPLAFPALRWRAMAAVAACVAGFFWAAACAHWRMAEWLPHELEGRDIAVVGVVSSLPAIGERGVRFELDVEDGAGVPRRILLSWYRSAQQEEGAAALAASVHPGERWAFTVRLRRPHGLVNPNGFDYEAWLLERGIGATGYVRNRPEPRRLGLRGSPFDRIERAREAVRERFSAVLGATPAAGILAALAVGDQRAISREEWQLFNRTGVTHLMSISGLHVTLVSGLAAWLVASGWRRVPWLVLRLPARKAAAAAAIAAALGYTLMAGFGVPAQRTFWMVTVVAAALWFGRVSSPWRTLALALAPIVVMDPWAPLSAGLWLSFGAVLLIFYAAAGWTGAGRKAVQWGRIQWAITIGLAPAALLLFGQLSVAGPLANAFAIPLVSVIITPLALIAAVVPADGILDVCAVLVEGLLQFLEWCAALPAALWQQHVPPLWTVVAALGGAAWMLAPRGVPWRASGAALMAPAFCVALPQPAAGEAWITTFDVGQGLAVLVRTQGRALLYDAGPAYGTESDSGARVVVPALRGAGLSRLDLVVLSHEDTDHMGGALSVLETFEVGALASSLAAAHPINGLAPAAHACAQGQRWEWDGVRFEFLHPPAGRAAARRNDRSCVLRVAAGGRSMLLTGDIERAAEMDLVKMPIRSEVLLVPHHGSRTSSSREFIAAVAPAVAIVPVGYRSRFGHPSAEVLERYRARGTRVLRTDLDGAITLRMGDTLTLETERQRRQRYWLQSSGEGTSLVQRRP